MAYRACFGGGRVLFACIGLVSAYLGWYGPCMGKYAISVTTTVVIRAPGEKTAHSIATMLSQKVKAASKETEEEHNRAYSGLQSDISVNVVEVSD